MSEIIIDYVSVESEIYDLLTQFAPFFHNQAINNKKDIKALADKFSKNGLVMKGSNEDITVGFCAYYANDFVQHQAFLSMIVVAPSARGMGVGRLFLQKMIEDCQSKGMGCIRLEVADDNDKAIRFYERNNFHKVKQLTEKTSLFSIEL